MEHIRLSIQSLIMNIFYLDTDIKKSVQYHSDKHVVKMIVETAQLLSTAHRVLDGTQIGKHWALSDHREQLLYKATHINHPCAIWVRSGEQQYDYASQLLFHLIYEYKYRYKNRIHKCEDIMITTSTPPFNIPKIGWTDPPQCMPDDSKDADTVQAYRKYYMNHKRSFAKWTSRETPGWFI